MEEEEKNLIYQIRQKLNAPFLYKLLYRSKITLKLGEIKFYIPYPKIFHYFVGGRKKDNIPD